MFNNVIMSSSSRGTLMVEMALRKRIDNYSNENHLVDATINACQGTDSDDEPLSKLLDKQGPDKISPQSFNNEVITEGQILFELSSYATFSLPPDLLEEMKTQNVIKTFECSEKEYDNSLLITNENNVNLLPLTEDDAILKENEEGKTDNSLLIYNKNIANLLPLTDDDAILEENEVNLQNKEQRSNEDTNYNRKRSCKSKREETKAKRLKGDRYIGYMRSKDGKIRHNKERENRIMKNRCIHKIPQKQSNRSLLCGEISEEMRDKLFQYFWNLPSWSARKSYLKGLVSTTDIRRRRKSTDRTKNRKKQSHDCFLKEDSGKKVLVCRTMLLNTFALGRNTFERWTTNFQHNKETSNSDKDNENEVDVSSNRIAINTSNVSKTMKQQARQWLSDLPKVPSHYCRSSSSKLYLESIFRSTLHIYKVYTNYCTDNKTKPISRTLFRKILKSENIAIHKPRKDQCDLCCSWKAGNISDDIYNDHIRKKNEAELAKREAKESLSEEKFVVTMDLQSVLLAPKLEASAIYYKQKLQIHNFTVYALNNKNVDLYVWHESNGNVTANEFTSCIVNYIETTQKERLYKHIILISDGCGYQNRNKVLSSALLKLSENLNIIIEQLILERGHTMMEADSVHSSLEAHFKPPMYSPSDYVTRMRQARNHHPYRVHNLDFSFFRNYENVENNLTSIKPGRDSKVTDIRGLLYLPTGNMKYKLNHSDEWVEFLKPRKIRNVSKSKQHSPVPEPLYHCQLKIKKQKFDHLQELKKIMESDYHSFYDSLPHN